MLTLPSSSRCWRLAWPAVRYQRLVIWTRFPVSGSEPSVTLKYQPHGCPGTRPPVVTDHHWRSPRECSMAPIIGIDPHEAAHTAVAIDMTEQPLAQFRSPPTAARPMRLLA